jgi:AraC family transcriptional activator of pobA
LIFHNSLFCHFAMNEVIPLGRSQLVRQELRQIEKELTETPYQYVISIHSRIELILVEINRAKIRQIAADLRTTEAKRLFMYEHLSVKEVAYELGFNDPFYFSNFFKKQTRQSPKAYREKYSI